MTRSANEVMVLATKAARGAGAPPAQAAQFGAAAVAHLADGGDCTALDAALAALPNGPIMELPLALVRIAEVQVAGIATGHIDPDDVALAKSYVASLPYRATLHSGGRIEMDLNSPAPRCDSARFDLPAQTYAAWSALAAKLLVPESDASRLSGAGAGLTDND